MMFHALELNHLWQEINTSAVVDLEADTPSRAKLLAARDRLKKLEAALLALDSSVKLGDSF